MNTWCAHVLRQPKWNAIERASDRRSVSISDPPAASVETSRSGNKLFLPLSLGTNCGISREAFGVSPASVWNETWHWTLTHSVLKARAHTPPTSIPLTPKGDTADYLYESSWLILPLMCLFCVCVQVYCICLFSPFLVFLWCLLHFDPFVKCVKHICKHVTA